DTMAKLPGFVSANIHRSLDGTRVANYAQWRSRADFEAMLQNAAAASHMQEATTLAAAEPHLYEVVSVHEAARRCPGPAPGHASGGARGQHRIRLGPGGAGGCRGRGDEQG